MSFGLDEREQAKQFAAYFKEIENRLTALERNNQLNHASIEGGSLDIYDADGTLKGSIGVQPDGAVALVPDPVNTEPPPAPTAPTVESALAGLLISWDGQWGDALLAPTDFALIQVHVGTAAGFTPDVTTQVATITAALGGSTTVHIEGYAPVWVCLVAQNTAALTGAPSPKVQGQARQAVPQDVVDGIINEAKLAASAVTAAKIALGAVNTTAIADGAITTPKIVAGAITTDKLVALAVTAEKISSLAITTDKLAALAVTADKLAVNSVTATNIVAGAIDATHVKAGALSADRLAIGTGDNLISDPSFEGAVTARRVAGWPAWTVVDGGNDTAKALRQDAAANSELPLVGPIPAVPGQKIYLAADYYTSTDWAGTHVLIYAEWQDATGTALTRATVTSAGGTTRSAWARVAGIGSSAAPPGTAQVVVRLQSHGSTSGSVLWDNTVARFVTASGASGARTELSPLGLQLYDADGEEAIALVTGRPNFFTLSTDGEPVATIDQAGGAGFQRVAVADNLTIAGADWTEHLNALSRGIQAINYQTSTRTASGTEMGFVELAADIDATRMYRIVAAARANPSAAGGELQLRLRDGGNGAPTINSTQRYVAVHHMAIGNSFTARMEYNVAGRTLGGGVHRFLTTFTNALGPSGQTCTLYGGSDHPGYLYVEDTGPYVPPTGGYNDGGGTVAQPPTRYTKTYAAAWSGSYANRGSYNSHYGNSCYQGYYSSTNGTSGALIGFPSALGTDLSGATIVKAEVYLYFDHWYANGGGKAVIKAHKHTSRPSTFSSDAESQTISWARNEGKWVDITAVFDSTSWRGIALDPNSTSFTFYGRARGYGQTNSPKLRVAYTK